MTGEPAVDLCPGRAALEAFCRGDLPCAVLEGLATHVSSCDRCASAVAEIPERTDKLLGVLRQLPAQPLGPSEMPPEMLAAVAGALGDTGLTRETATVPSPPPPRLREYELHDKLGEGGMGTVYRAVHTELDKVVALKLLAAQRTADTEAVARFHREMKAVGKVSHPNIIQATDAGVFEGTHFLVMEFVEGIDLARLVRQRGPLPIADACEVARQTALGLQHAHEHGLVHRDVKPSNLMLSSSGQVKLLDLGLARLQGGLGRSAGESTSSSVVMGTYDFMAPEQAEDPHRADARADQYGLGCTLYYLLTGRPPFADGRYVTPVQKIKAHASVPVPPVRGLRPEVPEELAGLLDRLLAKEREARLPTAAQAARALRPFAAGSDLRRLLPATDRARKGPELDATALRTATPPGKRATPTVAAPRRPRRLRLGTLLALAALVLGLALSVVIYVQTDTGTLEIASDDRQVKVTVEQNGNLITILDLKNQERTVLRSGKYQLKLGKTDGSLHLETDTIVLKRGDTVVATIRRLPRPAPAIAQAPNSAQELKPKRILEGHTNWVCSLAFSRDGKWLASAGKTDRTVRVWDAHTFKVHRVLHVPDRRASCVAFAPDSQVLASASNVHGEGGICLWDPATGERRGTLKGLGNGVWDLAFSPDGAWLAAAGGTDRQVSLWDLKAKRLLQQTPDFGGPFVRRVAFAPEDRRTLAFSSSAVFLWDVTDKKLKRRFPFEAGAVSALRMSPDGKLLAAAHWANYTISLMELEGKRLPITWAAHTSNLSDVGFSPNGKLLASTGHDGVARLWDVATQRELAVLCGHKGGVDPVAFSPDGTFLATGGAADHNILLWDVTAFAGQRQDARK